MSHPRPCIFPSHSSFLSSCFLITHITCIFTRYQDSYVEDGEKGRLDCIYLWIPMHVRRLVTNVVYRVI